MSKDDKKVPFVGTNPHKIIATATGTYLVADIPEGKTMFITSVIVSNLDAAASAAGELHIYDETAQAAVAPTATNALVPAIRVPYQSTVVLDLGSEGIPVATEVSAAADAVDKFRAEDVCVVGYYL